MMMMSHHEQRLLGVPVFNREARNKSHAALVTRIVAGMHGALDMLKERNVTIEDIWAKLLTSDDERIRVAALTAFTRMGAQLADQDAGEDQRPVISAEPEPDGEQWLMQHKPTGA